MFGFFKRKPGPFDQKHYDIKYHHVGIGDDCELYFVCLNWQEAMNNLLAIERNKWIHIDWVDVKEVK